MLAFASVLALALVLLLLLPHAAEARTNRKLPPNVVVILADDLAWSDHGFLGNERIQMPTIDALADGGVVFPNGHLWASTCRPTHRGLLTGIHHALHRVPADATHSLPRIIARSKSKRHRYHTFQGGKLWELGPEAWGFGTHTGHVATPPLRTGNRAWAREGWDPAICGSRGNPRVPCPATRAWPAFLDSIQPESGDRFFAFFTPALPHAPPVPPQAYVDLYANTELHGFEDTHYPMTTWLDEVVWEIVDALDERDLRRETLIVYLVDNGYNATAWIDSSEPTVTRGKASLYERGFRTPIVLNGPGASAGHVYDDLVALSDVFLTIAQVTGSMRFVPSRVRGYSLACRAAHGAPPSPRTEVVTEAGGPIAPSHGTIVRTHQWRYIRDLQNGTSELYAIDDDPNEEQNLAGLLTLESEQIFQDLIDAWRVETFSPETAAPVRIPLRREPRGCRL